MSDILTGLELEAASAAPTCGNCEGPKELGVIICAACLASLIPSTEDIGRMFDAARAKHLASGAPSITREEADRRADLLVAEAYRKLGKVPPS